MTTALITGITGQDGSYLARLLLEKGYKVVGTIQRDYSVSQTDVQRLEGILDRITLEHADLLDSTSLLRVLEDHQPSEIYHLGAQTDVRVSFDLPIHTANTIIQGTLTLLDLIKKLHPTTRFFQASSAEMFGNSQDADGFQRETTPMNPVSPYGCAKLHAHKLVQHYRRTYGLFLSTGILFNHESPRRGTNFVTNKVVREAVKIKKGLSSALPLGNLDAARDWGHAQDYVQAMWQMLQHHTSDDFVVATGETHTVRELCDYVFSRLELDYREFVQIDPQLCRKEELHRLQGDSTKLRTTLGWKPEYNFERILDEMISCWSLGIKTPRRVMPYTSTISSSVRVVEKNISNTDRSWEVLNHPVSPILLEELEIMIKPGKPLLLAERHPELYAEVHSFWEEENVRVTVARASEMASALATDDKNKLHRMQRQIGAFNRKHRLSEVSLQGNRLGLALDSISYLEFIGINELSIRDREFRERLIHAGSQDFSNPTAYFANPLAMCAVLYGYDDPNDNASMYVPVVKRSDKVMHCPNMYHVFGTLVDVDEYSRDLNPAKYLLEQVEEKTGLQRDQLGRPELHAIIRQGTSQIPELICSVPVQVNRQKFTATLTERAVGRYEHSAVSCYDAMQIPDFLFDRTIPIVPSGAAALSLFMEQQKP